MPTSHVLRLRSLHRAAAEKEDKLSMSNLSRQRNMMNLGIRCRMMSNMDAQSRQESRMNRASRGT